MTPGDLVYVLATAIAVVVLFQAVNWFGPSRRWVAFILKLSLLTLGITVILRKVLPIMGIIL